MSLNPVSYFEIPVHNLQRAMLFYGTVFAVTFEQEQVDGNEMAFFPFDDNDKGASGALAQGDSYLPGKEGARLYFDVQDIATTLERALQAGGAQLFPITDMGRFGLVAEFQDSEGNCIALRERPLHRSTE